MFASLSLGLALLPFVVATVHDVQVGGANGLLEYSPEALLILVEKKSGDVVVFHFNPKNHTVSQSAFATPCGLKEGGFHSGFMPVAANSSVDTRPTFSVTVNDTTPVWVYCGQAAGTPASHCGAGMVFAINCPTDSNAPNSFTNFKAAALAIGASLSAAASAASATPTDAAATGYGAPAASPTVTAAYGGVTIPPAPSATLVTAAITLDSTSVWTTIYTSFANSPAATPVAVAGAVHTVVVGGSAADGSAELFFSPSSIRQAYIHFASPRDQVVFEFHQKNHSVIQSAFTDPCRKLNADNTSAPVGFNSGFFAVAANATEFPTWTLTVNDTAPIWAYCGQTAPVSHCGKGMVFAINAVNGSARDFSAFQALAEQLNGTATNASASGATDTTGGALSLRVGGASALLTLVAIVASLL
ncbi:hypothetical protein C8R44DRAFT_634301 [Mycena epipterygia]|nr:hypothetical protein C8R44DRAFT_634301 [Mycena epipterygia]